MRSKLVACAAIAVVTMCPRLVSEARAASSKAKAAAKRPAEKDKKAAPTELHADDKSMNRQMRWEDKVMGPDTTRADLARVARARALNEKAIQEREAQAAREAVSPPPPVFAKPAAKRAEVALPSVGDGADGASHGKAKDEASRHEISPALSTAAAMAPPPPSRPADDKFIDKLLRDDPDGHNKKKVASASDRELDRLLAGANEKPAKRGDDVDSLIRKADAEPAMPAPREQSQPAWMQQPDIRPSAAVASAPVAPAKPSSRRADGVIRVVQGVAGTTPVAVAPARPARSAPRGSSRGSSSADWADPFADSGSSSPVAARDAAPAPAARKAPAAKSSAPSDWSDPFADKPDAKADWKSGRSATPSAPPPASKRGDKGTDPAARPAGWKDPFTEEAPTKLRAPVAMRDGGAHLESARWEAASEHQAPRAGKRATTRPTNAEPRAATSSGWGVLKKSAR